MNHSQHAECRMSDSICVAGQSRVSHQMGFGGSLLHPMMGNLLLRQQCAFFRVSTPATSRLTNNIRCHTLRAGMAAVLQVAGQSAQVPHFSRSFSGLLGQLMELSVEEGEQLNVTKLYTQQQAALQRQAEKAAAQKAAELEKAAAQVSAG